MCLRLSDRKIYLNFDSLLKTNGIVGERDYSVVHDWMDNFLSPQNNQPTDANPDTLLKINTLVEEKSGSTNNQLLTDYLRVALGHLVLQMTQNNFVFKNEYELMKRTFQVYTDKDFGYCCFKAPTT